MAEQLDSLKGIQECINKQMNFVLSGGAGSGKTYSLIEVVDYLFRSNVNPKVACITYTNVAVKEIRDRAPYSNLWVSTIHEFLWNCIKKYQFNLKKALVDMIERGEVVYKGDEKITMKSLAEFKIDYKDWSKLSEGVVSHDEVMKLAEDLFNNYPLIRKIFSDTWDYILVDEYQDTFPSVINIFLKYLKNEKLIIGFFGDPMQSIYGHGVGDLTKYINNKTVKEVIKPDNWRCSLAVIELINQLRNDDIKQEQKSEGKKVQGSALFLYSETKNIEEIKKNNIFSGWNFDDPKATKELYLTHNLISNSAGFGQLFRLYNRKDPLFDALKKINKENFKSIEEALSSTYPSFKSDYPDVFKIAKKYGIEDIQDLYISPDQLVEGGSEKKEGRGENKDELQKHLDKIQRGIDYYKNNQIFDFIEVTDLVISNISDKKRIKAFMDDIIEKDYTNLSIGEVIDWANKNKLAIINDDLLDFIKNKGYIFDRVRQIAYIEFFNLYNYNQKTSPYSTQHGVKGAEYKNVFIVLDNGGWNNYNFEYMFLGTKGKESVVERTKKLFYVGCSRAKENLVVYYHSPNSLIIKKAIELFGKDKVIDMDKSL